MFAARLAALTLAILSPGLRAQLPAAPLDPLPAVAAMPVQPTAERGVPIEVRDADGKPVAAAIVLVAPWHSQPKLERRRKQLASDWAADPIRQAAAIGALLGSRYALDAEGQTRAPIEGTVLVCAFLGEQFAQARFTMEERPTKPPRVRLTLRPLRRVPVEVTTHGGLPAAGIAVSAQGDDSSTMWPLQGLGPFGSSTLTGADGKAILLVVAAPDDPPRISVPALTRSPVAAVLPAGEGGVKLVLPPCGSVRVTLRGSRAENATMRWLLGARASGGNLYSPTRSDRDEAVFACVEPGTPLTVHLNLEGTTAWFRADVPAFAAGEEAHVAIDLDQGEPRIAMQLRAADGTVLADKDVVVFWPGTGVGNDYDRLTTDGDGRLELQRRSDLQPATRPQRPGQLASTIALIDVRDRGFASASLGCVEIPLASLHAGRNDLGPVQLALPPLFASGTVVDGKGMPLAGVRLVADLPDGRQVYGITAVDGAFELRVHGTHPDALDLAFLGNLWFFADRSVASQRLAARSKGNRVVAARGAPLRVQLEGLPTDTHVQLTVHCESAEGGEPPFDLELRGDTDHLLLPAGRWHLGFRFAALAEDVFRIEGVEAAAGIENHDARLMPLDWRQFASLLSVQVLRPDGGNEDHCAIWHRIQFPTGSSGTGLMPHNGRANLLVPKDGGHVQVRPQGQLRVVDLGVVTGEQRVQLRRAPRLTVQWSALPKLPAGVSLQLMLEDGNGDDLTGSAFPFDASGKAETWAVGSGSMKLVLAVRKGNTGCNVMHALPLVEVGDDDKVVPIEFGADLQRAIDEALGRLRNQ